MQEEEERRCHLQIHMRLGNKLIAYLTHLRKAYVWVWVKKHSYTSEKELPIHSHPKLLIWYALANAASLVAMPLPHTWTWHPVVVQLAAWDHRAACMHNSYRPGARAAARLPPSWQPMPRRHGQAMESAGSARLEPAGNPSHAACVASVILLIQQLQCCPE